MIGPSGGLYLCDLPVLFFTFPQHKGGWVFFVKTFSGSFVFKTISFERKSRLGFISRAFSNGGKWK